MGDTVPVYSKAAVVITVLVLLDQVLECRRARRPAAPSGRC